MNTNSVISPKYRDNRTEKQYLKLEIPKSGIREDVITDETVTSIPEGARDVLGYLAQISASHPIICPSQKTIAQKVGKCDRQVRRYLDELIERGLIATYQRWNNSLLYRVDPVLLSLKVRNVFAKHTRAFRLIPLMLLSSTSAMRSNVHLDISYIYLSNTVSPYTAGSGGPQMTQSTGISDCLRSISCIRLTKWGQIYLARYPDEALSYAQREFQKHKIASQSSPGKVILPADHFEHFKSLCEQYCSQTGIYIDAGKSIRLNMIFPKPDGAAYYKAFEPGNTSITPEVIKSIFSMAPPETCVQVQDSVSDYDGDPEERIRARFRARGIRRLG